MPWFHQWCLSCLLPWQKGQVNLGVNVPFPFQCSSSHVVIILLPFYPAWGIEIFYTRNLNRTSSGIINFHKIYGIYLLKKKSDLVCVEAYKRLKTKTTHSVLADSSMKKLQGSTKMASLISVDGRSSYGDRWNRGAWVDSVMLWSRELKVQKQEGYKSEPNPDIVRSQNKGTFKVYVHSAEKNKRAKHQTAEWDTYC